MNDYAGLLGADDRARLESRLAERERATGTQMAIAIFPSLEGESLEDVSIKLAEAWRIGQKGLDNGIILVVFVQERKLRLEVGYGLEGSITDAVSSQIIREMIAPRFREGRFADGLAAAVNAVYERVEAGPKGKPASSQHSWPIVGFGAVIAVIAIILGMEAMRSRGFVERRGFTTGRGRDASGPVILPWGWGGGGRGGFGGGGGGGGGFSGGGGGFGGGGASGDW